MSAGHRFAQRLPRETREQSSVETPRHQPNNFARTKSSHNLFCQTMCCSPKMAHYNATNEKLKLSAYRKAKHDMEEPSRPMKQEPDQVAADEKNSHANPNFHRKIPADIFVRCPPVSSGTAIRSRFLHRLGIQACPRSSTLVKKTCPSRPRPVTLKEPLKHNSPDCDEVSQCSTEITSSLTSSESSMRKNRSVSFDDSVTVRPIPMRTEYSARMKQQIWSDRQETYRNAARNSIEFAAENWDWRQVAEDEDMVQAVTGELIHPIHYIRQCDMQRNFLLVMAARQEAQQCN